MKHIKSKKYTSFFWLVVLSFLSINLCHATEPNIAFNGEMQLSESELSSQSGQGMGSYTNRSNADLNSNTINISPGGSVNNGNNIVSGQAFSGVDGIPTVVQNSGNNVIIQNSTIVNMSFQ
jgi:hypothetical protein